MNGKSGLFPSNFVKEVEVIEDSETNHSTDESGEERKNAEAAFLSPWTCGPEMSLPR